jgi:hypothetical protein
MSLFETSERTERGIARVNEDTFSFLNRSGCEESGLVRDRLERFYRNYPPADACELRRKFQSDFSAAFFELVIHELLLCLECDVVVHPSVACDPRKPDFGVRFLSGAEVAIEATVSTDRSESERKADARLEQLYHVINCNVESPDFFLYLKRVENVEALPPPKRICRFIQARISAAPSNFCAPLPHWIYRDTDGFELEFTLLPKSEATRQRSDVRAIGVFPSKTRWGGSVEALKKSIKSKAAKYRKVDRPFVIAVNAISRWGADNDDVVAALFGLSGAHDHNRPALLTNHGPRNRAVSAVLVATVSPWNIEDARLRLYHNPFAHRTCADLPWKMPQALGNGSDMQFLPGAVLADLLHLAQGSSL